MKLVSLILSVFFAFSMMAQSTSTKKPQIVKSKKYNMMLDLMLKRKVPEISCAELNSNYHNYIVIDTREINEYKISHLPNAIHVGYENFNLSKMDKIDKSFKIVAYCSIGYRSEKIVEKLIQAGYNNVQNFVGSSFEWANQSLPLVNSKNDTVKMIHAYDKMWGRWMTNPDIEKIY